MSPENLFFHGSIKTEVIGELRNVVRSIGEGYLFSDRTRVSSLDADLSAEPDAVYVSADALDSGRVRLVPSAGSEPDSFVELEGAPNVVVEIVSDSSVAKDTKRLPISYWRAGIAEYWLIDVRRERLSSASTCAGRLDMNRRRRMGTASRSRRSSDIDSVSSESETPAACWFTIYNRDRATASMEESSRSDASVLQIDHVNLVVRDMAAMIAFYRDALGMTLARQVTIDGPWIDDVTGLSGVRADCGISGSRFRAENRTALFPLAACESIDGLGTANVLGLRHIAFRVNDIDRMADRVRAAGREALEQSPFRADGGVAFAGAEKRLVYFHDPEGNLLELCEYA